MKAKEFLTKFSDVTSLRVAREAKEVSRPFVPLTEIGKGNKVLDLGCGNGKVSKLFQNLNNEVCGIEINAKLAAAAQEKGIRVKVFDLNDGIPFEDDAFDLIVANDIVESIYDTKFLFDECNRVLRAGGHFLLCVRNLNSLSNRIKVLSGSYLDSVGAFPEDHLGANIRLFNRAKIEELARFSGFAIEKMMGLDDVSKFTFVNSMTSSISKFKPALANYLFFKLKKLELS